MKILIVTPRYYPESFSINNISEELANRGHDVTVLTGRPNYGKWRIFEGYENVSFEKRNNITIYRVKEKARNKGFLGLIKNYISIYKEYKKFLRKFDEKYDVVLAHILSPILAFTELKSFCSKNDTPIMAYGLDIWPESLIATGYTTRKSPIYKHFKRVSKKIYNSCDLIAYASPSVENYLRKELDVNVPFKHIYQPCLTKLPDATLVSTHTYKKNNFLSILYCGTIARFNHLELIIEAISKAKNKDRIKLKIVGSGSQMDAIIGATHKYGLDSNVTFTGRVPSSETVKYYVEADALFVPLYWNSATSNMIPQKLIEYFMYQRPILGMLKGDGAELLKNASQLNINSDQTSESLAESIDRLFDYNSEELVACGYENRMFYEKNKRFDLNTVVTEIENELLQLAKNK